MGSRSMTPGQGFPTIRTEEPRPVVDPEPECHGEEGGDRYSTIKVRGAILRYHVSRTSNKGIKCLPNHTTNSIDQRHALKASPSMQFFYLHQEQTAIETPSSPSTPPLTTQRSHKPLQGIPNGAWEQCVSA